MRKYFNWEIWTRLKIWSFYFANMRGVKIMQVALIITVIILVMVTSYQSAQLKDLEQKTLDAFKIVCKKLKAEKKDEE